MSRRRPGSGVTISLFPFLAVLLCTMGALLVLLVIFSRRARESDLAASRAAEQDRIAELELARDELRWRIDQLRDVRSRTADDLARERMRLAGVEEDARRLADEIDRLERTAAALEAAPPGASDTDLAAVERRLNEARAALDAAREARAGKPPAYAVVPYEEAGGTHRRPLYVECCIDGVFLQPEGIRLGPSDFEGPPGPGNPLASALRAAREQLARQPGEAGDPAAQPYPLLLVRPSGVMAYYAARESLVSWGSEFGYQFIDEEWQLAYPPADPALAAVEQRAIEESRRRMEWLAQVRPPRPARPTQHYRASTTRGGVVAEGGPTVLGDQSRFDWTDAQAAAGGGRGGPGRPGGDPRGNGQAGGDAVLGGISTGNGAGGTGPNGGSGSPGGGPHGGPSRFYAGQPADGPGGGTPNRGGSGDPAGSGGELAVPGGGDLAGSGGGADAGAMTGDVAAAGHGAAASGGDARPGAAGGPSPGRGGAQGAGGGSAGSAGAGAGGLAGGPALPGMAQGSGASATVGRSGAASGSLANSRGSNWASLATNERPIPLTRPIRVECAANEFRIFDDGGTRVQTRVPIATRTADSVDPLVRAVHDRVTSWGLAGDRMYWRPELVLSETADGRSRRDDLERLLADSGLDTRRGGDGAEVRRLPPVTRTSAVTGRR